MEATEDDLQEWCTTWRLPRPLRQAPAKNHRSIHVTIVERLATNSDFVHALPSVFIAAILATSAEHVHTEGNQ
jgi:hypothetical protein